MFEDIRRFEKERQEALSKQKNYSGALSEFYKTLPKFIPSDWTASCLRFEKDTASKNCIKSEYYVLNDLERVIECSRSKIYNMLTKLSDCCPDLDIKLRRIGKTTKISFPKSKLKDFKKKLKEKFDIEFIKEIEGEK
jgi:hypothetical protein